MDREVMFAKTESMVVAGFPKQFACHLQFVREVAKDLHATFGGDWDAIHIASIAHDIGRVEDGDNEKHAEIGAEKIIPFLRDLGADEVLTQKTSRCIFMHNKTSGFECIEEEIVNNADHLSKLLHHTSFMMMVKKETYIDRAKWGLKYVEKSYDRLTLKGLKEAHKELYESLRRDYVKIIGEMK